MKRCGLYAFFILSLLSCGKSDEILRAHRVYNYDQFFFDKEEIRSASHFNQVSYFRFLQGDSLLMIWNVPSDDLKLLRYPSFKVYKEFNLDTIADGIVVLDLLWDSQMLYLMGRNKCIVFNSKTHESKELNLNASYNGKRFDSFSLSAFPLYVENYQLYLGGNSSSNLGYLSSFNEQIAFFGAPLEVTYDLKTGGTKTFGSYPWIFRTKKLNFYNWFPRRIRFSGRSVYSFAHVDSLYVYDENSKDAVKVISRKSVLSERPIIPFELSKLQDYSYIRDYHFLNDHYSELISDPFRNLIYSIFIPGVDPPKDIRLSNDDIAFSIQVFDSAYQFKGEVLFPPGIYDNRYHFVGPEGLFIQTAESVGEPIAVFDIYNLNLEGAVLDSSIEESVNITRLPSLDTYLKDEIGLKNSVVDSLVVIAGLGCKGCLESLLRDAELKGVEMDNYIFVSTIEAYRSPYISDFLDRQKEFYIDRGGKIKDYRVIGDFLTLISFEGDSISGVDDKFSF